MPITALLLQVQPDRAILPEQLPEGTFVYHGRWFALRQCAPSSRTLVKILIVEQDEDIAELVKIAFELDRHIVAVATSSDAALRLARQTDFDSYLVDLRVRPSGGFSLLTKLEATANRQHKKAHRQAIAWDASPPEDWSRTVHGFHCFLLKPAWLELLREAVEGRSCPKCGLAFQPQHNHAYCGPWP